MSLSLRSLSDKEVLSRMQELTRRERSLTLSVLLHLNEIERRKLHLAVGYASMFDYCTSGLGYSASAASRRIRTSRCVARFPEVYDLLVSNEVNLSTVSQVARVMTRENMSRVLEQIRGKSQREVEALVAEYQPRDTLPRDSVRTVVLRTVAPAVTTGSTDARQPLLPSPREDEAAGLPAGTLPSCTPRDNHDRSGRDPVFTERRALVQFCASEGFMAKVEKIKSLAWHRLPANASLEQVFELALDGFIEKEDPSLRSERRARRAPKPDERDAATSSTPRHIPRAVRDQVFVRDNGQCAYQGPNGRRCASTRALQIDHVHPVARGGKGTPDNLRLLCAYHNRLEAERLMGPARGRGGP
jgi:5-methylcytosine-specific restriction endonuclease McrA